MSQEQPCAPAPISATTERSPLEAIAQYPLRNPNGSFRMLSAKDSVMDQRAVKKKLRVDYKIYTIHTLKGFLHKEFQVGDEECKRDFGDGDFNDCQVRFVVTKDRELRFAREGDARDSVVLPRHCEMSANVASDICIQSDPGVHISPDVLSAGRIRFDQRTGEIIEIDLNTGAYGQDSEAPKIDFGSLIWTLAILRFCNVPLAQTITLVDNYGSGATQLVSLDQIDAVITSHNVLSEKQAITAANQRQEVICIEKKPQRIMYSSPRPNGSPMRRLMRGESPVSPVADHGFPAVVRIGKMSRSRGLFQDGNSGDVGLFKKLKTDPKNPVQDKENFTPIFPVIAPDAAGFL